MKFMIDAQRPPVLARWLTARGHEAHHVHDLLHPNAEDEEVWGLVCRLDTALMTKDEDFVTIRLRSEFGPHVVWLRLGNATNATLFAWLEPRLEAIIDAMHGDTTVIEVR